MSIFKKIKNDIVDPIKEQFMGNLQRFSEADSKYKWVERVVAKANAAIWGLTSPMAPIVKPLQKWVEKWMEAIDNTWKAVAQKIGDTLSPEQKEALRTKLAPRFEGEWADKVAWVLQKIMESPYTEAGINAVSAIIWAKASGWSAPKTIVKPRWFTVSKIVTPSNIFKSKPTYNQYARWTAFGERNIVQAVNDAKWAEWAAAESEKIFNNKRFVKNLDDTYNKMKNDPTRYKEVPEYEMTDPGGYDPFDNVTRPAHYDIVWSKREPKTTLDYTKEKLFKITNKNTPLVDIPFDVAYARARYWNSIPMNVLPKRDRFFRENPRMYDLFKKWEVVYDRTSNRLLDTPTSYTELERMGETWW